MRPRRRRPPRRCSSRDSSPCPRPAGLTATPADERAIADAVTALELAGGMERPATRARRSPARGVSSTRARAISTLATRWARASTAPRRASRQTLTSIFGDDDGRKMAEGVRGSSSLIQRTVTSLEAFTIQQAIRLGSSPNGDRRQGGPGGAVWRKRTPQAQRRRERRRGELPEPHRLHLRPGVLRDQGRRRSGRCPSATVRLPYPVPRDPRRRGRRAWLDTTYLGENVRISKGNKGTTFVLVREATDGTGCRRVRVLRVLTR